MAKSIESEVLVRLIIEWIDSLKGQDIVQLNVKNLSSFTDYMIVVSGNSERHIQSMAEHVLESAKKALNLPIHIEGLDSKEWLILDFNDVVLHIMLPATRQLYSLEKLWGINLNPQRHITPNTH